VCEEHKDALLAAWEEELVENKNKERAVSDVIELLAIIPYLIIIITCASCIM